MSLCSTGLRLRICRTPFVQSCNGQQPAQRLRQDMRIVSRAFGHSTCLSAKPRHVPASKIKAASPAPSASPSPSPAANIKHIQVTPPSGNDHTDIISTPHEPAISPGPSTSTPAEQVQQLQQYGRDARIALCGVQSSTKLYNAGSQTRFATVSYTSSVITGCIAKFNIDTYLPFMETNKLLVVAGAAVTTMWMLLGVYFGTAPQNTLRAINVLPSKQAAQNPATNGPLLELHIRSPLPFMGKPKPLVFHAADLTRDCDICPFVYTQGYFAANERLRFSWGKGFFRGVRRILNDVLDMSTRKNFVYIRTPNRGTWKLDMRNIGNIKSAAVLEEILRLDQSRKGIMRKMMSVDNSMVQRKRRT